MKERFKGGILVGFFDKIKDKLNEKQEKSNPEKQMMDMANGLEEMVNKQLKKENLNPRTKKQLENVLNELDNYRDENM